MATAAADAAAAATAAAAAPEAPPAVPAHPVLSLAIASGLHSRLGADSPISSLPDDLVREILEWVRVDPIVVPGSEVSGAWTDNAQYYRVVGSTMTLRAVWWLDVGITAKNVPRGHYSVVLEMTAGSSNDIACTVAVRPDAEQQQDAAAAEAAGGAAPAAAAAAPPELQTCSYVWTRAEQRPDRGVANQGRVGRLSLGTVELDKMSTVRVSMVNHDGHKSGIVWHRLVLVPSYRGAPQPAPVGWTVDDSATLPQASGGGGGGGGEPNEMSTSGDDY
eukprot:SAG22_NODE_395_length_11139_cov_14.562500_14_plen_276_part_00